MRQLMIQVPRGEGQAAMKIAQSHEGANLALLEARGPDGTAWDLLVAHVENRSLGPLLDELETIPKLHATLAPRGVMTLRPPPEEAAEQVRDVDNLSPIEVFLGGLQSVGSWTGFLGYAALAGVVVWIGLFTSTSYLLVAAMLIAPFAGPAMNLALATARGDRALFKRSIVRYFVALAVTVFVAWLLSTIFRQDSATAQMLATSKISAVTVLLPLAAGAAGAVNLFQSERSSLVSGAATGMLVAASLAPPAGLVGMSAALGSWDMAVGGAFLLMLQLVGINLVGAIVFRLFGLTARGTRYERGSKGMFPLILAVTALVVGGLLTWQLWDTPNLQRATQSQRAAAAIQELFTGNDHAKLVEANVRFTRANIAEQDTLLAVVYVQRVAEMPTDQLRLQLSALIQRHLRENFDVTPLVAVTVLDPPPVQGH